MTVQIGEPHSFADLKFRVNTTVYTSAGDSITRKLNKVGLSLDTYARRHYVTNGKFISNFPDTDISPQTGETGTVWPFTGNIATDTFTITALEDNSSYVCVIPTDPNYQVIHEVHGLVAGQVYGTATGKCYIPTVDCSLYSGGQLNAGGVLVCATNSEIITPLSSGSIMVFSAIAADQDINTLG
jgi:hypothetical protein